MSTVSPSRSTTLSFQKRFVHESFGGERLLRMIARLEDRFPKFFGRVGQYPMFVFRK